MIETAHIGGGTRLLVDTAAATGVAAVSVWYNRGSRDELSGERGMTHFVEHMLFKGTKQRKAYDIAREIDRLGGAINAFTERETTVFHAIVPEAGFESASDVLLDIIENAVFDVSEFDREKSVILNELSSAEDDPEEFAGDLFTEYLWPDSPLGTRVGGTTSDVELISRDALFSFYTALFQSKPSIISIAGDISFDRACAAFSQPGFIEPIKRLPRQFCACNSGITYSVKQYQQAQLLISFAINDAISSSDYYELEIANAAFGESMGSRLFQSIREELGLCYSIYSSIVPLEGMTLLVISVSTNPEALPNVLQRIFLEITHICSHGFISQEISDAKTHIGGGITLSSFDMEYRTRRLARQELFGNRILELSESREIVEHASSSSIHDVFLRFFTGTPFVFALGPRKSRASFQKAAEKAMGMMQKVVR